MQEKRRGFLKKSVQTAAAATALGASTLYAAKKEPKSSTNGVVSGKAKKNEVLYFKSEAWEKYYKTVY